MFICNGIGCIPKNNNSHTSPRFMKKTKKQNTERELFQFISPTERMFTWKTREKITPRASVNSRSRDCAMARLNHLHLWRITNVGLRVIIIRSRETHTHRQSLESVYIVYFVIHSTWRIYRILRERLTLVDRLWLPQLVQVGRINTRTHTHTTYTTSLEERKKKVSGFAELYYRCVGASDHPSITVLLLWVWALAVCVF